MLRERDAGAGKIQFVDIAAPEYSPEENSGVTYSEVNHVMPPVVRSIKLVVNSTLPGSLYDCSLELITALASILHCSKIPL